MSWFTETFLPGVLAARQLNQLRDNFRLLELHRHTGESGEGASTLHTSAQELGYANEFSLWCYLPVSQSGSVTVFDTGGVSVTTLNGYVTYLVGLRTGRWELRFLTTYTSNRGIVRISINGNLIADIDLYIASTSAVHQRLLFDIYTAGVFEFKWECIGQNPASSGFVCSVDNPFTFRRLN